MADEIERLHCENARLRTEMGIFEHAAIFKIAAARSERDAAYEVIRRVYWDMQHVPECCALIDHPETWCDTCKRWLGLPAVKAALEAGDDE
jgi:hypothetical protein